MRTLMMYLTLLASIQWVYASAEFFVVERNPEWTQDGRSYQFVMRDGTPAPEGLRVQGLAGAVTNAFPPPQPATVPRVLDGTQQYGVNAPPHIRECMTGEVVMGRDSVNQGYPAGPGCASAFIEGDDEWYGVLRAYSAPHIEDAAYYGDTELRQLETLGDFNDTWHQSTFPMTQVNPAYTGLTFDVYPVLTDDGSITGSVNTTATGGNNQLDNTQVRVMYSMDDGATWIALADHTIEGDGDFRGRCGQVGQPLVRVEGISALAGLPNSGAGVVPVPEPLMGVVVMAGIWVELRRGVKTAGIMR